MLCSAVQPYRSVHTSNDSTLRRYAVPGPGRERNEWVFETVRTYETVTVACKWESRGFFWGSTKLRTELHVEWAVEPNVTALNCTVQGTFFYGQVYQPQPHEHILHNGHGDGDGDGNDVVGPFIFIQLNGDVFSARQRHNRFPFHSVGAVWWHSGWKRCNRNRSPWPFVHGFCTPMSPCAGPSPMFTVLAAPLFLRVHFSGHPLQLS